MRIVLQRVNQASVKVEGKLVSEIQKGFLILLGVEDADTEEDIQWLCKKVANLRVFSDSEGKMNLSAQDVGAKMLVVSQFTLYASTKKGNRPSFIKSAKPQYAEQCYENFCSQLRGHGFEVGQGIFGADMKVQLENDGPVTIVIDSKNKE